MSIGGEIRQVAQDLARNAQSHLSEIEREIAEIEERKTALMAQREFSRGAEERLFRFQPQIGGDFQCPRCWVDHEKRSVLTPIGGGTQREDFWRCHTCGFEMSTAA